MIMKITGPFFILAIVAMAQWSEIRTLPRTGKLVFFLLLAVSGIIWLYTSIDEQPLRPAVFLEALFKHLDPFA